MGAGRGCCGNRLHGLEKVRLHLDPPMRVYRFTVGPAGSATAKFTLEVGKAGGLWIPLQSHFNSNEMHVHFGPDGGGVPIMEGLFFHFPTGTHKLTFEHVLGASTRTVWAVLVDPSVHVWQPPIFA